MSNANYLLPAPPKNKPNSNPISRTGWADYLSRQNIFGAILNFNTKQANFGLYNYVSTFYYASMSRNETGDVKSGFNDLCAILCRIEEPSQMQAFLEEILTPAERKDLSLRWELMRMLKQGVPQRQIAASLGISLCKITRGAKILKQEQSISKQYLDAGDTDGQKNPIA